MSELSELEKLMTALGKEAITRASALDPKFAAQVEEGQKEIDEHQKALDAQHAKKQEPQPAAKEFLDLQKKMIETAPRPK